MRQLHRKSTQVTICVVQTLILAAGSAQALAGPKIAVSEPKKELGTITEGDKPTISWLVKNEGDADLVIERTQSTCGCTVVKLDDKDKVIPPGAALELKVEFNSQGRRGVQTKSIGVFTNDSANPETKLEFHVQVDSLYEIDPAGMLNVRAVQRGQAIEKTIDIIPSAGHAKVEIQSVRFDNDPPLSHQVEPIPMPSGTGQRIRLRVNETASVGTIATVAIIRAKVDGTDKDIMLPVRADVVGDLNWSPLVLDASRQNLVPGRGLAAVTVRSAEKAVFDIVDVDAGPLLDATYEQVSGPPGRTGFTIMPVVREGAPPGPFAAMLKIYTNSLDQPLISVPVFGIISAAVEVEPPVILLRPDGTPAGTQRLVKLQADPGVELKVNGVSCDNPAVKASVDTAGPKPRHQQFIKVLLNGAAAPARTTLRVSTNIKGFEQFDIPLVVDAAAPKG